MFHCVTNIDSFSGKESITSCFDVKRRDSVNSNGVCLFSHKIIDHHQMTTGHNSSINNIFQQQISFQLIRTAAPDNMYGRTPADNNECSTIRMRIALWLKHLKNCDKFYQEAENIPKLWSSKHVKDFQKNS